MTHHNGPLYLKYRFHLVRDELDEARTELRALVYRLRQRGSADSLSQCLIGLAQVEIQRGRCGPALTIARQSLRITEEAGLSQGPAWYAVALAETAGGSLSRALTAAEAARRHSEDDNDRLFLPRALHAEGRIRLFRGQSERAVELLACTGELETAQGQRDPATRRWHADLAEALAATGRPDEADAVLATGRRQAERLARTGVLATLDRAAAVVAAQRGELTHAAALLESAAGRLRISGYPLEEARARVALGRVRRRLGDEGSAHAAFAAALRVFTKADARPLAVLARAERDRAQDDAVRLPEGGLLVGTAHIDGAERRRPRRARRKQPRDRGGSGGQRQNRGGRPDPRLPQAGRQVARGHHAHGDVAAHGLATARSASGFRTPTCQVAGADEQLGSQPGSAPKSMFPAQPRSSLVK